MVDKLTIDTIDIRKLEAMDEVELAKLCKRSGLHPGSNSKAELVERIKEAKSNQGD